MLLKQDFTLKDTFREHARQVILNHSGWCIAQFKALRRGREDENALSTFETVIGMPERFESCNAPPRVV